MYDRSHALAAGWLEQLADRIRCDKNHYGVLQCNRPHVSSLMPVHAGFPTELAGLNSRNLAYSTILDHL